MLRYIKDFAFLFSDSRKVINIDVFEWDLKHVLMKKLPNHPDWARYAISQPPLEFTLWQLAHAVIKTDFLIQQNHTFHSIGFIFSAHNLLKLAKNDTFRVIDNINSVVNDFSLTGLIGRIGQGLTLLLSHRLGYVFVGHLASDPAVKAYQASLPSPKKQLKIADFLCEDIFRNRVIFESKCTSSLPVNDPSDIKGELKKTLRNQVDPWLNNASSNINNGYVVHSSLRGENQPVNSAITYVDPPGQNEGYSLELSPEWVKIRNYAAWFRFAGFSSIAEKLLNPSGVVLETRSFGVERLWGGEFVILNRFKEKLENAVVIGVDVQLMRAVENYFKGEKSDFINYRGIDSYKGFLDSIHWQKFAYSLFPDGTLLGEAGYEYRRGDYQKFSLPA